nr:hypothetical protein [Tanacetum cinerariifolium]
KSRRKVTEVPQPSDPTKHVADKAVNEEMDDNLERAATTHTSLDAEQDRARVESSKDEDFGEEDASKQGRIADIDANEDIYLVNVHNDEDMFGVNDLDGDEVKDKVIGKMVEQEPMKKLSKKDQLMLDEELAFKLQAEEEEKERLAREKVQQIKEVNIAWDDVQAKIDADYELDQRLQAEEQEELTDAEKKNYLCNF